MARGGRRQGAPAGTRTYSNRTDLNANRKLPIQAAPNQAYGAAGAQMQSQKVVPLRPQQQPGLGGGQPAAPAPAGPQPGSLGAFDRPTDRPQEPISAGAPFGPGPGPEAMAIGGTNPNGVAAMLSQIAAASGSQEIAELARRAQALGAR